MRVLWPVSEAYGPRAARCLDQNRRGGKPEGRVLGNFAGSFALAAYPAIAPPEWPIMPPRKFPQVIDRKAFHSPPADRGAGGRDRSWDVRAGRLLKRDSGTRCVIESRLKLEARPGIEPGWIGRAGPMRCRSATGPDRTITNACLQASARPRDIAQLTFLLPISVNARARRYRCNSSVTAAPLRVRFWYR